MTLLNEIPILNGSIEIKGSVFYVSQEPWLFPGTIKANILFGKDYDKEKFIQVLKACSLDRVS
jgi:ATP-binding cassette, subfamily C (CFTR/MRP), member 4